MEESVRRVRRLISDAPIPIAIIGLVLFLAFLLWLPYEATPDRNSELGAAMISGGIVALAIVFLEQSLQQRQQKRDLQLRLALGKDFRSIDLRGVDLSGSYLVGKNFREAKLQGADLRGANLAEADLINARLDKTDLRGTIMYVPPLVPSEDLFPGEDLFPSEGLHSAMIYGTTFTGAWFDDTTRWPDKIHRPEELGAVKVEEEPEWA